ncbi:MAG TPA: hypothetical protein VL403_20570, partial [Candidatus Kryptonia bacterium]|nr:hypothetical protein [Candidatus Kryptonia bacterium]
TLGRANLDGTDPMPNFISGLNGPCGVAVAGGFIYWANSTGGPIGRATVDGMNVENAFVPTGASPCGVAVDLPPRPVPAMSPLGLLLAVMTLLGIGASALSRRRLASRD